VLSGPVCGFGAYVQSLKVQSGCGHLINHRYRSKSDARNLDNRVFASQDKTTRRRVISLTAAQPSFVPS
jgi:hypothetical protein